MQNLFRLTLLAATLLFPLQASMADPAQDFLACKGAKVDNAEELCGIVIRDAKVPTEDL